MSEEGGQTSSESVLFAEHQQAKHRIAVLTNEESLTSARNDALTKLRRIYDKYLECPTILDSRLEEMVSCLANSARYRLSDGKAEDPFENTPGLSHALSAVYALCKVRGYKRVKRFLPHEARDVEPIFRTLHQMAAAETSSETQECGPMPWESVYVLWVWMGMLSLVPFDYSVLSDDSFLPSLLSLAKSHLAHAGPTRDAASSCLASWLSRPDLQNKLASFIDWSHNVLVTYNSSNSHSDAFIVMGVMQTLAGLVKTTTNRTNLDMERLWEPALVVAEGRAAQGALLLRKLMVKWFARMGCACLPPRLALWRYQRGRRSLLENMSSGRSLETRKSIDASGDPGGPEGAQDELFHVPDEVEDAMGLVLQSLSDPSTVVRWSAAKGIGRMTERLPSMCADDVLDAVLALFRDPEMDHAWHGACLALAELSRRGLLLPNRLGDVVPLIIRAIQFDVRRGQTSVGSNVRDAACYTYWAFARAYAPSVLKPFVSDLSRSIVVASLFDREVNCRRAASAAFQECVGRQGAYHFKHGISILTAADYYSLGNLKNAYTTVAEHVAQFEDYRKPILVHLYKIKLNHWDPSIRILASKSLHRLSSIDADFVINEVVPFLVTKSTDDNLFTRHGAVLGLAETVLSLAKDADERSSELARLSDESRASIVALVQTIEKKRLYRGRGGEIMRSAVCRFIECMSLSELPLTVKQQVGLLDTVDTCLKHPSEVIQSASSDALHALMRSYFPVGPTGPSDRLQNRVVDKYMQVVNTSVNPAETRGFTLALGVLPRKLLAPSSAVLSSIIDCLCKAASHDAKVGDLGDAETRRNAIAALARICEEVGVHHENWSHPAVCLSSNQVSDVFETFILALEDYNTDRRGDIGSWSRMAAMTGLESLTYIISSMISSDAPAGSDSSPGANLQHASDDKENRSALANASCFGEDLCVRIVGGLLKQLSEKLDVVRAHAGACLERMLTCDSPPVPNVPQKASLLAALGLAGAHKATNWANGTLTFKMVMAAADIDVFFYNIISGLVVSVGGLGESVAKPAEEALLDWIKRDSLENGHGRVNRLANALPKLFRRHQRDRRVTFPLLKTIDILLSRGCLDPVVGHKGVSFSSTLFPCLKTESYKCTDVHRLLAIVSVSLGILSSTQNEDANQDILVLVLCMLGHPYPRVRRYTADHLYVRLSEDPVVPHEEAFDNAMELLLEGQWDSGMELTDVRELRDRVAELLGVSMPKASTRTSGSSKRVAHGSKKQTRPDEFASYSSLVNGLS